jgi:hypothetical protein
MKKDVWHIPIDEKIPKGYRRQFILQLSASRHVITVSPTLGLSYQHSGKTITHAELDQSYDWIGLTVCSIRDELLRLAKPPK